MKLHSVRLRVRPLTPVIFLLVYVFSGGQALFPSLIALGLHESAHLWAAFALHVRIHEIEVMPFGAAIRLYDLWEIAAGKMIVISLAGPISNILLAALCSLFLYGFPRYAAPLAPFIRSSLLIGCMNLLPALPLDGGRALVAAISRRKSSSTAVKTGILLGRIAAAAFLVLFLYSFVRTRKLSLMPLLFSVYFLVCCEKEKRQAEGASMRALLLNEEPAETRPARIITAYGSETLLNVAKRLLPGERTLICVLDAHGGILGWISQNRFAALLSENAQRPLSETLA